MEETGVSILIEIKKRVNGTKAFQPSQALFRKADEHGMRPAMFRKVIQIIKIFEVDCRAQRRNANHGENT
jgi:hypothetical protein